MNCKAPSHADYLSYYPNGATSNEFESLITDAETYVDALIFPNIVDSTTDADVLEQYRKAICAVVNINHKNPDGVVSSYTVSKNSETFLAGSMDTRETAAKNALSGSGLLCRWL